MRIRRQVREADCAAESEVDEWSPGPSGRTTFSSKSFLSAPAISTLVLNRVRDDSPPAGLSKHEEQEMRFDDRPLFQSSMVTVGVYRCHPTHPEFWYESPASGHLMVFPRSSVRILQSGARPVVADPNVAVFYNGRQVYRREAICETGDRCEWFAFPSHVVETMIRRIAPNLPTGSESPFAFRFGLTDAATYLTQRNVYRHICRFGERANVEWIEETMLGILQRTIESAVRLLSIHPPRVSQRTNREHRELVQRARQVIAASFRSRLTLQDLADRVSSSPFHLSRLFRRFTGRSIHQYLTQLRLRTALEDLEPSNRSLTSLALNLGFSSHSHFTYAFRQHFGLTPTAWQSEDSIRTTSTVTSLAPA